jgi:SAM-dependent methyltransferase
MADLGAGDGGTLWPLDHAGLIGETIYAVDISAEHVALCERLSPKVKGIVSDVAHVEELPDGSVDAVISSQVIEHLPDDRVLAPEIARLLRPARILAVQRQAACAGAVAARSDTHARVRIGGALPFGARAPGARVRRRALVAAEVPAQ